MSTIRDVAKACGVSTATVSNVLNARSFKVSAETRERVLAAIRALRYTPTALEKNQKAIHTSNLALVCGDMSSSAIRENYYFARVFDGVLEEAAIRGWSVTVFVEKMWSDSGHAVRRSYDGRCDGVLLIAPDRHSDIVPKLQERGVPLVSVGTTADHPGVSSVDIDNEGAASELTKYLIELGHSRIAYCGPGWTTTSSLERSNGYCTAMSQAGLSHNVRLGLSVGTSQKGVMRRRIALDEGTSEIPPSANEVWGWGSELTEQIFHGEADDPTAVVCWNEDLARCVARALIQQGIEVPNTVSVAGFDDANQATNAHPYLTTMRQPFRSIGKRAVDMLISRIQNPDLAGETVRFKAELVVRESTGPAALQALSRVRQSQTIAIPTNGGNSL